MSQGPPTNGRGGDGRGSLERMPPQAVEVEQAVLGAMLIDGRAVGRGIELLDEEAFYHAPHARIFGAMTALFERNEAVDQLTVGEELKRRGQLDAVGGAVYLAELAAGVASAANIEHHAKIVVDRGLSRGLIEASAEISGRAFEGRTEVYELIDWAEQRIFALSEKRLRQGFEPIEKVLHETFEQIERAHKHSSAVSGVDTGFTDLNEITSGFQPGDLVVMAARPSVGKSALALSFACNAAVDHGVGVAVFTLEMSKQQVAQRLLCIETRVDLHKLRTGRLREEDWLHLTRNVGRLAQAPIYIDDTPGISVLEARAKARRLQREHGVGLVVIDYLQLMSSHEHVQSREQEVSRISRGLKALAKELQVPVLALSQLSRAPEARTDRRPQLSDLRESGCMPASVRLRRADTGAEITLGELVLSQESPLVWTIDERFRLAPRRVTRTFPTGIRPVLRVRLASGRTVDATDNHRFLTVCGWRRLDELSSGSFIAVPRRLPEPLSTGRWSDDEIVLLAHLLGDGSIGPDGVKYATMDPKNKEAVENSARRSFGIEVVGKKQGRTWSLWLPSPYRLTHGTYHPVRKWLEPIGLWGSRSHDKFVPPGIFGLDDVQTALFLRHLWSTDGSVTISRNGRGPVARLYYATTSRQLADDVQSLLLRLDIRARIACARKSGYRPSWHVRIDGAESMLRFGDLVGCHGARGERIPEIIEILREVKPNPKVDLIPWDVAESVKASATARGVTHRQLAGALGETYCGSYLLGSRDRPRRFSRGRLQRIADFVNDPALLDLARSDVFWDEVVEIEPLGEMPTFDATVDGTHNFLANGVVAHNSIEQDADVVMFIYRPDLYGLKSPEGASLEGMAEIIIGKQRNGPTGSVHLMWNAESASFENLAPGFRIQQEEEEFT